MMKVIPKGSILLLVMTTHTSASLESLYVDFDAESLQKNIRKTSMQHKVYIPRVWDILKEVEDN